MTKPKPRPSQAVEAVRAALDYEIGKRSDDLKPIEVVKTAICAFQAFHNDKTSTSAEVASQDRSGLRRGTQASVDRLLFNVNYWLAAYEDRIVHICCHADQPDADKLRDGAENPYCEADDNGAARASDLLRCIAAWNSHTMKLNTLSANETVELFGRFCPPYSVNRRRGTGKTGSGKGPVHDFLQSVQEASAEMPPSQAAALKQLSRELEKEAEAYEEYRRASASPLDAFYDLLPAWCLQDQIDLVRGTWWNDADVMMAIAEALSTRFEQLGFAKPLCSYYLDAMRESIDNYTRAVTSEESPHRSTPIPQLISLVKQARTSHPNSEVEGYGDTLPAWLDGKEQLIWNTVACAIFGPMHARPLLADDLSMLPVEGKPANTDVITELAQRAYSTYFETRRNSGCTPEYDTFDSQPESLRISGIERISSIPGMLDVLGYRIVPLASCYPEQRIDSFRASEVECLAILEHRRWLDERASAGWTFAVRKDIEAKQSPYLIDWDDLPDRVREWNRSTARSIPALLAEVGLAISQ